METPPDKPRTLTGYGKFAHVLGSVDDYLRRKQEDIDHEEERSRRRMTGVSAPDENNRLEEVRSASVKGKQP